MLDSRGFELKVGDEVLVVSHKNQIELAGTIITTRSHHPFNTVMLGTVVSSKTDCQISIGARQIIIGQDEPLYRVFLLPQHGAK
jgi:hypothetical protein